MGSVPDWYIVIRAAKYLGVEPWELLDKSPAWLTWATEAEAAENRAEKQLHDRANRKARIGS